MSFSSNTNERDNLYRFAAEKIREASAKKIIDVASNEGYGSAMIGRMNPNAQVIGIDINDEYLSVAKKSYSIPNVVFQYGDGCATEFPDASFDAATCFHVVEHMDAEHQEKFFAEMHRILKPGGLLIAATPDVEVYRLQGIAGLQWDHVREITQKEFTSLAEKHGFDIGQLYGQGKLKVQRSFLLRRTLNAVKKADFLKVRRLLPKTVVNTVDMKTHPVEIDFSVQPIRAGVEKASVSVIVAKNN